MKGAARIAAALGGVVFVWGVAATPVKLPDKVAAHVQEMADLCRQVNGEPLAPATIEHGNLSADLEFWAINEATLRCEGAETLYSGSHGSDVAVYVSALNGSLKQAVIRGSYGMAIKQIGGYSTIWITVAGGLCGQRGDPSTAELSFCERTLRWDITTQKLDFGPPSEAQVVNHLANQAAEPKQSSIPVVQAASAATPQIERIAWDGGIELESSQAIQDYWGDKAGLINWKSPISKRGRVYNWAFRSADGRDLVLTTLRPSAGGACDPLCPMRVFTVQHMKILDILACGDQAQHGISADHRALIVCGRIFPIPQVNERTAIMDNAPSNSDPSAYVDVVTRQRSKPADVPRPIYVDSALHNNSQVLISEWKDGTVEIAYDVPRPGLPVARGTLLFQGVRNGVRYSGTAYTFKVGCAPAPYAVTGIKDQKRQTIVLNGLAPHRDPHSCAVFGDSTRSGNAKLVFDTRFYGDE